tara:strand:+ start:472 stop:594 length:123 start_codon:yes stop_codon:yes gene_type:complete
MPSNKRYANEKEAAFRKRLKKKGAARTKANRVAKRKKGYA